MKNEKKFSLFLCEAVDNKSQFCIFVYLFTAMYVIE